MLMIKIDVNEYVLVKKIVCNSIPYLFSYGKYSFFL